MLRGKEGSGYFFFLFVQANSTLAEGECCFGSGLSKPKTFIEHKKPNKPHLVGRFSLDGLFRISAAVAVVAVCCGF